MRLSLIKFNDWNAALAHSRNVNKPIVAMVGTVINKIWPSGNYKNMNGHRLINRG